MIMHAHSMPCWRYQDQVINVLMSNTPTLRSESSKACYYGNMWYLDIPSSNPSPLSSYDSRSNYKIVRGLFRFNSNQQGFQISHETFLICCCSSNMKFFERIRMLDFAWCTRKTAYSLKLTRHCIEKLEAYLQLPIGLSPQAHVKEGNLGLVERTVHHLQPVSYHPQVHKRLVCTPVPIHPSPATSQWRSATSTITTTGRFACLCLDRLSWDYYLSQASYW